VLVLFISQLGDFKCGLSGLLPERPFSAIRSAGPSRAIIPFQSRNWARFKISNTCWTSASLEGNLRLFKMNNVGRTVGYISYNNFASHCDEIVHMSSWASKTWAAFTPWKLDVQILDKLNKLRWKSHSKIRRTSLKFIDFFEFAKARTERFRDAMNINKASWNPSVMPFSCAFTTFRQYWLSTYLSSIVEKALTL